MPQWAIIEVQIFFQFACTKEQRKKSHKEINKKSDHRHVRVKKIAELTVAAIQKFVKGWIKWINA